MKTLHNLTATVEPNGEHTETRGTISELHLQDERCPGWFISIQLGAGGLRAKSRRPNGASVAIPLAELLALLRNTAPEIFADEEAISATKKALAAAGDPARRANQ